jgi:SAM-dependent methyltransferase
MGTGMPPTDAERLERERLDADRLYNEALTALDRTAIDLHAQSSVSRDDVQRCATALILFLQRITAFVDTKDRQLGADAARRFEALGPALESIAELRTQLGVMQRTVQTLTRQSLALSPQPSALSHQPSMSHQPSAISHRPLAISHQPLAISHDDVRPAISHDDVTYLAFEDQFRGSGESIERRLREYAPIFAGAAGVVDLGCGRGEFLAALKDAGITARGVDANGEMAAVARERGLDVAHGDALAFLEALADESVGGLMAAQVVEHLEPAYLLRLLSVAGQKLKPGAPVVVETINAACWLAFFSSYIRDFTHVRPIHPETLQYLLRANGFTRVSIRYSAPVPEDVKMQPVELSADVMRSGEPAARALVGLAHTLNANAAILNNLLFSHLDYAAIGYRS